MKIESTWFCKICGNAAMGVYDGPNDADVILAWAQEAHDRLEPSCPYKFKRVEVYPTSDDKEEE